MIAVRARRSDGLLEAVSSHTEVAVVTHDNPDPDAIASGWGLQFLIQERLHKSARLIGGGDIVRAENLHMVRLLRPPLELMETFEDERCAVILVDSVPTAGNHLLEGQPMRATAVIDHHQTNGNRFRVPFRDIRPRAVATASIVTGYLREQDLPPPTPLATALLYAIRTEMTGQRSRLSRLDRGALSWLTDRANHAWITEIENAPLSRAYFGDLLLAIENTFLYANAAICFLPRAAGAEIIGEVADLLIRCDGVDRVLCAAVVGEAIVLSARTTQRGGDGCSLLRRTVQGLGHCGGHRHRAGGKVLISSDTNGGIEPMQRVLRERWLEACAVDPSPGSRLVPRNEILDHLCADVV